MNVKAIEHVNGLFDGNNLRTLVNHVVHERGGAPCFRSSPLLSKLFLTHRVKCLMEWEGWLSQF